MRRVFILPLLSLVIINSHHSYAQDATLSDSEKRAAYCLAVFRAGDEIEKIACDPTRAQKNIALKKACDERQQKIERLIQYLTPAMMQSDIFPVAVPMSVGKKDAEECMNYAKSQPYIDCFNYCRQQSEDLTKCANNRCDPPICKKIQSCDNMDYLPY